MARQATASAVTSSKKTFHNGSNGRVSTKKRPIPATATATAIAYIENTTAKVSVKRVRCLLRWVIVPVLVLLLVLLHLVFATDIIYNQNQSSQHLQSPPSLWKQDYLRKKKEFLSQHREYPNSANFEEHWKRKQDFLGRHHQNGNNETTQKRSSKWEAFHAELSRKRKYRHRNRNRKPKYSSRQRPSDKIVYLLHIHKSAGTLMCNLARVNGLSVSTRNCNVQMDQRCCGHNDSLQAQAVYANYTKYDLVASETQMYEGMDLEHYKYIVVLRNSQNRYFSHWKHVLTNCRDLPMAYRQHEEKPLEAAGGRPVHNEHENLSNRQELFSLMRESKEQRAAKRQERMQQMEAFQRERQAREQQQLQNPKRNHQQQSTDNKKLEHLTLQDFTEDANKHNKDIFFPQRRVLLASDQEYPLHMPLDSNGWQQQAEDDNRGDTNEDSEDEESNYDSQDEEEDLDDNKQVNPEDTDDAAQKDLSAFERSNFKKRLWRRRGGRDHTGVMPHPAELPNAPGLPPIVGLTFDEWWKGQPDNWSFRQICGTHCMGIPKYQLTLEDWEYTLQRFLSFDTVLFMEELQTSVHQFVGHVGWNVTSDLNKVNELAKEWKDDDNMSVSELPGFTQKGIQALKDWVANQLGADEKRKYKRKKKEPVKVDLKQIKKWDPLMAALDDALYDIGQRWEAYKAQTGKTSDQLSSDEQEALTAIEALPEDLQFRFQKYLDDVPGNHRYQCQTECCAEQCTAY